MTRIEPDGSLQRHMVDTAQQGERRQWEDLAARAVGVPTPYRPAPGVAVYHVSVDDDIVIAAEPDLAGPLLDLVTAVMALGVKMLRPAIASGLLWPDWYPPRPVLTRPSGTPTSLRHRQDLDGRRPDRRRTQVRAARPRGTREARSVRARQPGHARGIEGRAASPMGGLAAAASLPGGRFGRAAARQAIGWCRPAQTGVRLLMLSCSVGYSPPAASGPVEPRIVSDLVGVAGFEPAASSSRTSGASGSLAVLSASSVCGRSSLLAAVRGRCCTSVLYGLPH